MHICVLGAGVVGTTSAYHLWQAGHEISLIDAQAAPAQMASFGNGAQLSYSYVAPLADPSVWTKWPEYLFSAQSPLTFRPQLDSDQWRWILKFLTACTATQVKQSTINLLQLAMYSRRVMHGLMAQSSFNFSHQHAGKLVMLGDANALKAAASQVAFQAEHGCDQTVFGIDACLEIEPALATARQRWLGGVYTASEEVADCPGFCRALVDEMARSERFHFLPHTQIAKPHIVNNNLVTITAMQGDAMIHLHADQFVIAMGVESRAWAQQLGFYLPIYPLKGYSISVPIQTTERDAAPQVSITDLSRKIVYARLGEQLRVAGRVELVGMNRALSERAVNELIGETKALFPRCADLSTPSQLSPWTGMRPATPTGLPIIGRSPMDNVFLNVGHGALGWTLACGSAALLTAQMTHADLAIDDAPYRLQSA